MAFTMTLIIQICQMVLEGCRMTKKSNRCTLVDSDHVDSDHVDSDDIRKNHGKVIDVDVGGGGDDAAASDDDDDDDDDNDDDDDDGDDDDDDEEEEEEEEAGRREEGKKGRREEGKGSTTRGKSTMISQFHDYSAGSGDGGAKFTPAGWWLLAQ